MACRLPELLRTLCRLGRLAIQVGLSRRTCRIMQYFRAIRPFRACLTNQPSQPSHPMKVSNSTHPRTPSMSSQPKGSRNQRSHPCWSSRPSRRIHPSHPGMRILFTLPSRVPAIHILAILVGIFTVISLGKTSQPVASVTKVILLSLTIIETISRLRITAILCGLGRLPARWPTIGYDTVGRIRRIRKRSYPERGARWAQYVGYVGLGKPTGFPER